MVPTVVRNRRRLGLRSRATLAWALIALTLTAGLAMLAYQLTRAELLEDRRERATAQAYVNARLMRSNLRATDPDVNEILSSLAGNADAVTIARVGGQWFAGSVGYGPDVIPASLSDAVAEGQVARQIRDIDGEPHLFVGVPIAESQARYFELVPLEDVAQSLENLARGLVVGATLAAILAALAGWYAAGRVLRPLRHMSRAAAGIANGALDTRLDGAGDPDLRPLQRSFNRMADAVEDRIRREHRFTSDVSHELRSPLAAMLSSIEIARHHRHDPEAVDEALAQLQHRAEAFHEMVVDLLEISRVDAGAVDLQLEPLDPRALVTAVSTMATDTEIPVQVEPGTPESVVADKRRLGRMVMNLVENAERYAGGATRIVLDGDGRALRIAVEDDGPGVPEHERRHVFGRFARGEDARRSTTGGTGLGLALVEEHARLHGGSVHIDDAPGGGARFVIVLPTTTPVPAATTVRVDGS